MGILPCSRGLAKGVMPEVVATWPLIVGEGQLLGDNALGDQSEGDGLAEKLCDVSHPETTHEIEPMDLDGADADVEFLSDFSVGISLGDEPKNLFLPCGQ